VSVGVAGYDDILDRIRATRRESVIEGVRLLTPTIQARLDLETIWRAYEDNETERCVAAIAACAVDAEGKALFDDVDRRNFLRDNASGDFVKALFVGCMNLLAPSAEEVEAAAGECEGDRTSEPGTDSPSS
jgi:hypothetical protein